MFCRFALSWFHHLPVTVRLHTWSSWLCSLLHYIFSLRVNKYCYCLHWESSSNILHLGFSVYLKGKNFAFLKCNRLSCSSFWGFTKRISTITFTKAGPSATKSFYSHYYYYHHHLPTPFEGIWAIEMISFFNLVLNGKDIASLL